MRHPDHLVCVPYCAVPEDSCPYPVRIIYVVRDNDAILAFSDRDAAEQYAENRRREETK